MCIRDSIKAELKDVKIFYLTTNLCPEHRSDQLESIKNYLKNSTEKVLIISTNLIEAGVDLSVNHVYRSLAGLDNIAQAAGRCNRNGEMEQGRVTVIQLVGDEFEVIRTAQKKTEEVCEKYNQMCIRDREHTVSRNVVYTVSTSSRNRK